MIAALVTLALVAVAWSRWSRGAPAPAKLTFELTEDALVARDGQREVWRKPFGHPLEPARPNTPGLAAAPMEGRIRVVDLDGDGEEEIVVAVPYKLDDPAALSDEVYCFSTSGQVRWRYKPEVSLRFRAGEFTGPWRISAMEIVPGPSASVYVALAHRIWWPAPLMRIDASGHAAIQFVQSGLVYTMKLWRAGGKSLIAAGGINNEYAAASVAMLAEGDPPAHSPQSAGSPFECIGCPAAAPAGYFVFARTELNRASDFPYNRVASFAVVDGRLQVYVQEDGDIPRATTMYEISPELAVLSGAPSDGYWLAHQRRQQPGRIDHDVHACRATTLEARAFAPASGWTTRTLSFRATAPGSHD